MDPDLLRETSLNPSKKNCTFYPETLEEEQRFFIVGEDTMQSSSLTQDSCFLQVLALKGRTRTGEACKTSSWERALGGRTGLHAAWTPRSLSTQISLLREETTLPSTDSSI